MLDNNDLIIFNLVIFININNLHNYCKEINKID